MENIYTFVGLAASPLYVPETRFNYAPDKWKSLLKGLLVSLIWLENAVQIKRGGVFIRELSVGLHGR